MWRQNKINRIYTLINGGGAFCLFYSETGNTECTVITEFDYRLCNYCTFIHHITGVFRNTTMSAFLWWDVLLLFRLRHMILSLRCLMQLTHCFHLVRTVAGRSVALTPIVVLLLEFLTGVFFCAVFLVWSEHNTGLNTKVCVKFTWDSVSCWNYI